MKKNANRTYDTPLPLRVVGGVAKDSGTLEELGTHPGARCLWSTYRTMMIDCARQGLGLL